MPDSATEVPGPVVVPCQVPVTSTVTSVRSIQSYLAQLAPSSSNATSQALAMDLIRQRFGGSASDAELPRRRDVPLLP